MRIPDAESFRGVGCHDGYKDRNDPQGDVVAQFREAIGSEFLDYGAAYYPWIHTSTVPENELDFTNLPEPDELRALLTTEGEWMALPEPKRAERAGYVEKLGTELNEVEKVTLHKTLYQLSPLYREIIKEMRLSLNLMPVSAAMAGVYTMTDNTKGVWKAPANTGVATAVSPAVTISHEVQEDLNVPLSGKSVNAIRTFTGEGIKVWGRVP